MPAYHTILLDPYEAPARPAIGPLAALEPVEWHPVRNVAVGQDSLVGSARRPIFAWGLAGAETWPWDATAPIDEWPVIDEWRVVVRDAIARLTPGSYLRLRILYVPSGNTWDGVDIPGNPAAAAYPDGWVRLEVTWTSGASSSGPHTYDVQLPAVDPDGDLPTGAGALWGQVRELELAEIFPPGVDGSLASSAAFSEGTRATFTVSIRGGARVIDATVVEHPLRYTVASDATDPVSVHTAVQGGHVPLAPMTPVPQTHRSDTDRRWGSAHLLRVAHQQAEVLGPRIVSWSPWRSDEESMRQLNTFNEDDVEPVVVSSSTWIDVLTGGAGYDPARAGWLVHASHAQLHRYCDTAIIFPAGTRAVVPVRVHVRAVVEPNDDPPGEAVVRLQSSGVEWVDVTIPADGEMHDVEVLGWLECQVAADHASAVLQPLARRTELAIARIYCIDCDWGWTP